MKALLPLTLLTAAASGEVALTIYNQNLAVVKDTVAIELEQGENVVSYDRATAQLMPDSVVLRDPAEEADFTIREQSYRNDPVSPELLLSVFEGKTISFEKIYPDGKVERIEGKIIRSGYTPGGGSQSPVIEVDGELRFSLPGEPIFPSLGDDSILRPTLSWTLGAAAGSAFEAQLSYLTRGMTWEASYNLVAPEEGETVTLSGWITANNNSGTVFENATVKLVAGDVNVQKDEQALDGVLPALMQSRSSAEKQVQQKSFDGFHLYTLPRPITLRDQETKQVEFLRSDKVQASKKYVYDPMPMQYSGGRNTNPLSREFPSDVAIYWMFRNSEENGLGMPLPGGTMRFYREDSADGNLEFVGENSIDHTPQNEDLEIYTGNAFDLVGERKVVDFTSDDRRETMTETIEITLKNRSKKQETIIAREHLWRWSNWELETESDFEKIDADTVEFSVELAPDEVKTITYTATYTW